MLQEKVIVCGMMCQCWREIEYPVFSSLFFLHMEHNWTRLEQLWRTACFMYDYKAHLSTFPTLICDEINNILVSLIIHFQEDPEASLQSIAQTNSDDEDWEPLSIKIEVKEWVLIHHKFLFCPKTSSI